MILSKLTCVVLNPYIIVFKSLIDWCAIIDIDTYLYLYISCHSSLKQLICLFVGSWTKQNHTESTKKVWLIGSLSLQKSQKSSTGDQQKKQVHWYSKQWGFPIQADTPLNTNIGTNMELNKKEIILEDELFV